MAIKRMRAKYDGTCRICGGPLYRGEIILWGRTVGSYHERCVDHKPETTTENVDPMGVDAQYERDCAARCGY